MSRRSQPGAQSRHGEWELEINLASYKTRKKNIQWDLVEGGSDGEAEKAEVKSKEACKWIKDFAFSLRLLDCRLTFSLRPLWGVICSNGC